MSPEELRLKALDIAAKQDQFADIESLIEAADKLYKFILQGKTFYTVTTGSGGSGGGSH